MKYNYSLVDLLGPDLSYSQITRLLSEVVDQQYIEYNEDAVLILTEKGENEYQILKKSQFKKYKQD